jgi:hypothetical protein
MGIVAPELVKLLNRHSHTQVRIIGASEEDLLVILMNTGHEPSTAYVFHASFTNIPLKDADLFPVNLSDSQIPAGGSRMLKLRPRKLSPRPGNNIPAVMIALSRGTLTVVAGIKESTDERASDLSQHSAEYPTANLSPWVKTYILP